MTPVERPAHIKYGTDELMELIDLFNVSEEGRSKIADILKSEPSAPNAGGFFRYYNPNSKVAELEEQFKEMIGCEHALAVNSGTSALIAAMVAVGVGPGAEVIVPGYTFFATASAVVVAGGIPVIAEIDESLTLDPEAVEAAITEQTRAIVAVHMLGYPAKMDALREIADRHGVYLLEDCAQATGGSYKGKKLGAWGHMGCFSFDAYKVMGTGEGGMVTTDDEWLHTRATSYHDTAACWRPDRFAKERRAGELFCGENYRLSEMAGAVGLAQLRKLDWRNQNTLRCFNQLRQEIKLPEGVKWVEPTDPQGVCGYTLAMLFENEEDCVKAIGATPGLGGMANRMTQGARDWHAYWHWEHILERKTATESGFPYTHPLVKRLPDYSVDMCPHTRDILMRMGVISTLPTDTAEWNSQMAEQISAALAQCFSG